MPLGVAVDGEVLELAIYEDILDTYMAEWIDYGVAADHVRKALTENTFSRIRCRINCYGGDMFEGMAIYNLLRQSGKPVEVRIDGIAASAASLAAMAGDTIVMAEPCEMMIHESMTYCGGNAPYLRSVAEKLERHDGSIANVYAKRSGSTSDKMYELMRSETWLTASEALALGLCTHVIAAKSGAQSADDDEHEYETPAPSAKARPLSSYGYKHVPERVLQRFDHPPRPYRPAASARPRASAQPQPIIPPSQAGNPPVHGQEDKMKISAAVLSALGLTEESDQSAIEAAIMAKAQEPVSASEAVMQALGARSEAAALSRANELQKLAASILGMTESTTLAQAQAVLLGWQQSAGQVTKLAAQLASSEKRIADATRDGMIEKLTAEGKLPPALQPWARTQTAEQLDVFAAALPSSGFARVTELSDESVVTLTDVDRQAAKALGMKPEEFLAAKKRQAERAH